MTLVCVTLTVLAWPEERVGAGGRARGKAHVSSQTPLTVGSTLDEHEGGRRLAEKKWTPHGVATATPTDHDSTNHTQHAHAHMHVTTSTAARTPTPAWARAHALRVGGAHHGLGQVGIFF